MSENILRQGAEAKLYIGSYRGQQCLVKERFSKKYRLEVLDNSLTKSRINGERRASERCQKAGILVPKIIHVDIEDRKIYMEYFEHAITAKDFIIEAEKDNEKLKELTKRIGNAVGKMHTNNIIHGDLTTSNMLINKNEADYDMIMIDFGLSSYSMSNEDKGVDLYVLERALISTHSTLPHLFEDILAFYKETNPKSEETIKKFEEVRARGRKRTMVG
jgi:TP53 regulating kinase-like protein